MIVEEFSQLVQRGLPKFIEEMNRQKAKTPEGWDTMDEENWFEAYMFWVEEHGVGGPK